ncbi:hypothetical protein TcG_03681 [Trypanosoma cruzi]|nr:hypothetical protein TcG_03681 [Trypanosoma cruzi]
MGTEFARSSMSVRTRRVHIYVCALWWPLSRRDPSIRIGRVYAYTYRRVRLHSSRGGGFWAPPAARRRGVRITKRAGGMAEAKTIKNSPGTTAPLLPEPRPSPIHKMGANIPIVVYLWPFLRDWARRNEEKRRAAVTVSGSGTAPWCVVPCPKIPGGNTA